MRRGYRCRRRRMLHLGRLTLTFELRPRCQARLVPELPDQPQLWERLAASGAVRWR